MVVFTFLAPYIFLNFKSSKESYVGPIGQGRLWRIRVVALAFGTQRLLYREGDGITSDWGSLISTGIFEDDIYVIAHTLVGLKPLSAITSWNGI